MTVNQKSIRIQKTIRLQAYNIEDNDLKKQNTGYPIFDQSVTDEERINQITFAIRPEHRSNKFPSHIQRRDHYANLIAPDNQEILP